METGASIVVEVICRLPSTMLFPGLAAGMKPGKISFALA